jgi:hypothetical protein
MASAGSLTGHAMGFMAWAEQFQSGRTGTHWGVQAMTDRNRGRERYHNRRVPANRQRGNLSETGTDLTDDGAGPAPLQDLARFPRKIGEGNPLRAVDRGILLERTIVRIAQAGVDHDRRIDPDRPAGRLPGTDLLRTGQREQLAVPDPSPANQTLDNRPWRRDDPAPLGELMGVLGTATFNWHVARDPVAAGAPTPRQYCRQPPAQHIVRSSLRATASHVCYPGGIP